MSLRGYATRGVELLLVLALVALIAGAALGQPVLLGFVETGSMEPTLEPGDGFVAIPSPVAGDIEEGDVIVFEAQNLQGGGLTTHRVVGETESGYITRGDANPFTDQDGQEPPVTEGQIVATAWQVNGEVVVIPGLGLLTEAARGMLDSVQRTLAQTFGTRAFLGTQGLALLIAGGGLAVLLFGFLFDDERRQRVVKRTRRRKGIYDPRRLVLAMALFVALVSGGTMVAMSNTQEYGMVSASFDSENPTTVPTNETSNLTYPALNGGQLPVYAFYAPASSNVDVEPTSIRMDRGESRNVTVTLQAPPETGYYPQYVAEHRYFAVLPFGVVAGLYAVHPWLPTLVTSLLMGGAFLLVGFLLLGASPVRTRSRSRSSWF
ncbi:signal peptidase I [Natronomonas sp. CBA1123]|uniref:signal peptidase I n=1 Tax=Natronomonas sp. CBA1123 TaxID=2668070 RepID=UPI001305A8D0|nr:signal peptidase I [Natronomonas sp. CBA1123]